MKRLNLVIGKNGISIGIYVLFIFIIIIIVSVLVAIIIRYYYSSKIGGIKRDLFYIAQDCAKSSVDTDLLSYGQYYIDEKKLKNNAQEIINKNYKGNVVLNKIEYDYSRNLVNISVALNIKNIVPFSQKEMMSIIINDSVKFKLMEVTNWKEEVALL